MADERNERNLNLDPITDEAGAHPVGTGIGAASGGMAGAAAGAFGGPVGAAVGLVAGAVVGGLAGKATAEGINPTVEHAYWRERYGNEDYVQTGYTYDDYGPAYEYGWSSRGAYPGEFESAEPTLATAWAERRGTSSLTWDQARPATRAAWDRVDRQYAGGYVGDTADVGVGVDGAMDNDDVVDVLNDLLETCRDGEYGFREVAEHTKTATLKTTFLQRSNECLKAGSELQSLVVRYGGEVAEGGTTSGALHRGWVSVRGALGGLSDLAMLNECERGEDAALARYRKALKEEGLPSDVRALIERQLQGVQRNHDQIKLLRDQEKARA
ncbi:hypothetical protein RD110_20010 [Rhodoferax koreense]|uniref:DUF2383 domain-containing protein n=2 Tax=Rhodoferax koreensis TaxID=1842727 RepID=A0A1P8JZP1_9BURK|nr:PA2169 family four-helix-bundle protein [Rhodoferax koreense]APW39217.1 hypothetical protein RD110_20010 [Rhodoferax koreense]